MADARQTESQLSRRILALCRHVSVELATGY